MKDYIENVRQAFKWKHAITYLLLALFLVVILAMDFSGMLSNSTARVLPRIAYSIILAVSLNLIVGFLGELSLGHAGFMCVGAYLGSFLANYLRTQIDSQLLVLLIAMVFGGVVAAVFGFLISLPALRLKGDYLAIVTLAFGEIVRTIFKNMQLFGGAKGLSTTPCRGSMIYVVGFLTVIVVLFCVQNLIRSKHGRAITAIRDNEIAARAMGINVTFYKVLVFVIAAFFAGVAGVLYGHYTTPVMYTAFSYNYSIEILVMVVLGGIGSMKGSIIAATLITYLNLVLQNRLSGDLATLRLLVYALLLIIMVLFNNAPVFKPLKEKINIKALIRKLVPSTKKAEVIHDDDAAWNRIESKIEMDAILSVDLPKNEEPVENKPEEEK